MSRNSRSIRTAGMAAALFTMTAAACLANDVTNYVWSGTVNAYKGTVDATNDIVLHWSLANLRIKNNSIGYPAGSTWGAGWIGSGAGGYYGYTRWNIGTNGLNLGDRQATHTYRIHANWGSPHLNPWADLQIYIAASQQAVDALVTANTPSQTIRVGHYQGSWTAAWFSYGDAYWLENPILTLKPTNTWIAVRSCGLGSDGQWNHILDGLVLEHLQDHALPEPDTTGAERRVLEAENRNAAAGAWQTEYTEPLVVRNQAPAPGAWLEWHGRLQFATGYSSTTLHLAWARTGDNQWAEFDVLAGPDTDRLRVVLQAVRVTCASSTVPAWTELGPRVRFSSSDSVVRVRMGNQNGSTDTRLDALLIESLPIPDGVLMVIR